MATEIDDSGSHGYDAPLTGTFTTDAANKVLEMGADGSADTGFTLPTDSDWLLVEVYDINGTAGHIGFTKWQSSGLGNMGTDVDTVLSGYYTTINAEYGDSTNTFKAIATLYDTSASTATVMEADDTAGFDTVASPSYTKSSYTPPTGTWKITKDLVAPADTYLPIHISFGEAVNTETPPTGWTITDIDDAQDIVTAIACPYEDNTTSGVTLTMVAQPPNQQNETTTVTGSDSACGGTMSDYQLYNRFKTWEDIGTSDYISFDIYLPAGTYNIQAMGSRSGSGSYYVKYTVDGTTIIHDCKNNTTTCALHEDIVSTGETFQYDVHYSSTPTDSYYGYINGMNILRTA